MTIDSTEFDGDSHTRKADWFGMTVLFGACVHLYKFQFVGPQNDTERVRLGAITDHARHDLAARPAGKFQFVGRWDRTGRNILYYSFSWKTLQDIIGF